MGGTQTERKGLDRGEKEQTGARRQPDDICAHTHKLRTERIVTGEKKYSGVV